MDMAVIKKYEWEIIATVFDRKPIYVMDSI